jgi:hypothetical protein
LFISNSFKIRNPLISTLVGHVLRGVYATRHP